MRKYLLILSLIMVSSIAFCQKKTVLKVVSPPLNKEGKKLFYYKQEHADSLSALKELQKLVFRFRSQTFILASADSIYTRKDTLYAHLEIGPSWRWSKLSRGNLYDQLLNRSGYKEKFYSNTEFKYSELVKFQKEILTNSENYGYPFATIGLDSIKIQKNSRIEASLNYQPGPFIVFDSIVIYGNSKIKKKFLMRYLRITQGAPFSQEKVNKINKLIKELPYLKQVRPMAIAFDKEKAIVHLYLEDRKSNQVDGIVGILPNQTTGKKLLVTGELNLNLKNMFGTGKNLSAEWKKFNQASQTLDLFYVHPRILASNLDVKVDFNLLKQDTSFINISRRITVSQVTNKYGRINFYGGLKTSRELLGSKISDKSYLPPFTSSNYYTYGIGYDRNTLDDPFYPHKGWNISTQGLIGNKTIIKSSGYGDSLYKNIQLKSTQLNFHFTVEKFNRLGKNSVFLSRIEGGHIFNNQKNIFYNDMFRVGGLKSLRGFNENNFYASTFGVATLEYRFFTDETSYLLLFFDQAYIRNPLMTSIPVDFPYGFGAGISFSTKAGVFNFVYSLGNSKAQKLNFNLSKIHFGLISRF